jgi:folate-binding protein YgfZ
MALEALMISPSMDAATLEQLRQGRLALPLSRARWKLQGPDRVRYLNGQVTNDVKSLQPGNALYAAACTAKGKMQGDLMISATADALWIDSPAGNAGNLGMRLERYLIADNATLEEVTPAWTQYHVLAAQAPTAPEGSMLFLSQRYGLEGWDVWAPGTSELALPCASPDDLETFRIRQGLPGWGREMDETTLPQEMRFDLKTPLAISYSKGCYTGQETIARIKSIGHVNKILCQVACDALWSGDLPTPCLENGQAIGGLTSVCPDPEKKGASLGLAVLRREFLEKGGTFLAGSAPWRVIS